MSKIMGLGVLNIKKERGVVFVYNFLLTVKQYLFGFVITSLSFNIT